MTMNRSSALPLITVPSVNNIEFLHENCLLESFKAEMEPIGDNMGILLEVFASDLNPTLIGPLTPILIIWRMTHEIIPV
jgi:hypothetical protein